MEKNGAKKHENRKYCRLRHPEKGSFLWCKNTKIINFGLRRLVNVHVSAQLVSHWKIQFVPYLLYYMVICSALFLLHCSVAVTFVIVVGLSKYILPILLAQYSYSYYEEVQNHKLTAVLSALQCLKSADID